MRLALSLLLVLAVPAGAQTLLIGNKNEDSVSLVDLNTGRQSARLATGKAPHEIAISPDGSQAAVVAYGEARIDLIDVARRTRIKSLDLGANARPHGIAWLADGRIVATTEGSDTVVIVDPVGGAVRTIATGQEGTHMLAVTRDGRHAYTANMGSGSVSVLDLMAGRKLSDIRLGGQPEGIALSADARQLWVADRARDHVIVLDLARGSTIATIPVGKTPIRIALSPNGREAVTSNYGGGTLSVIDTATRRAMRTIMVGTPASQQVTILFARDGKRLYVAETGANMVAELEWPSGRLLRRLAAGRGGDGLGIAGTR